MIIYEGADVIIEKLGCGSGGKDCRGRKKKSTIAFVFFSSFAPFLSKLPSCNSLVCAII